MPVSKKHFRMRVRNKDDDADLLVLTSHVAGENPYITEPPDGDGESFDQLTGEPTTGSYTVRAADPETEEGVRPITSVLTDVYARQQMIGLKSYVEHSDDNGATWPDLVVGYNMGVRLPDAAEYEFEIGQSRRIEASRTIFKEASEMFPGVTSVIGGPVIGGFINDDFLADHGGWTFEVDEDTATHTKLALVEGFDPRKFEDGTFTSTSTAIADFTNNWARAFFEPSSEWSASDIQGFFPGLRARLLPIGGTDPDDVITLVPLARPSTLGGVWYDPTSEQDRLTGFGTSQLYLPKTDIDGNAFDPAIGTQYQVWVYAVAISKDNPLHWYGHPVDLWESLRIEAGIPYDASVLPGLKALIGDSMRVALRIMESSKLGEFDQKVIYGPFRLSTRIENGDRVLFRTSVIDNPAPTETITLDSLRSYDTTVFDLDEGSAITTVTVKTKRLVKWSSEEADQPEVDALISRDAYPQSIDNSADDIPAGTEREVVIGDIPGMIVVDGSGPINLTQFLTNLGSELFDRFGRGAIKVELDCLPDVTARLGEEVMLDLPHLPGSLVGATPVSQRSPDGMTPHPFGPQPYQIVQKTAQPEGPKLVLVNSLPDQTAGESYDLIVPEFTLEASASDPTRYGLVTFTNAVDLIAAGLNAAVYFATGPTEPAAGSGVHFVTFRTITYPPSGFDVGPIEEGGTLWVQMRAESPGFRPGAWTPWQSVGMPLTPATGQLTVTGYAPVIS